MKTFKDFIDRVPKLRHSPLPGLDAQLEMAAMERLDEMQRANLEDRDPKNASVMMLIYEKDDIPHFVLIERVKSAGKHSGQIAFPGGRSERGDPSHKYTAIRETFEEIGVAEELQEVVMAGTPLYIPPSNYMVFPYLAFAKARPQFKPQKSEVNGIIEIPLAELLKPENVTKITLSTSYMKNVTVPCYRFGEIIVWGATAMMLNEFKAVLLDEA